MKSQFHSNDIACGGCTATIEKALSTLSGVSSVAGEPSTKTVTVEHDETLTHDAILAKLDEIGFTSTVVG